MAMQQAPRQIEITIPEPLYQWLSREAQHRAQDISALIRTALEQYAGQFDLTQTRTWQLCGAFTIAEPEEEYVDSETEPPTTNYAEHVDDVLYKGT